ncbi:Uncharacterised protein [Neisseria subflava]|uniref:Uncharacterized protein n=1 Tax=Neisseria subflava TaxID=28449 RepID=A0A9X9QZ09_NEISU|nr:Uncharacterised protein [Neisseria subflava]
MINVGAFKCNVKVVTNTFGIDSFWSVLGIVVNQFVVHIRLRFDNDFFIRCVQFDGLNGFVATIDFYADIL